MMEKMTEKASFSSSQGARTSALSDINAWTSVVFMTLTLGVALLAARPAAASVGLQQMGYGMPDATVITHAGDGSGRVFVALKGGQIRIIEGVNHVRPTPFLDLSGQVSTGLEQGLLGLAFDPDYEHNGRFYVDYTNVVGSVVVASYTVSSDPNVADAASSTLLLTVPQPYANNKGGQLAFGPDGHLYVGMGDGGGGGDPLNNAQNPQQLLGKILRLDVSAFGSYIVPETNPFSASLFSLPEIWALGLKNPHFSFDRDTGDLYIADAGQARVEEINVQAASSPGGENYGWRLMEGNLCFKPSTGCNPGSLTPPAITYAHSSTRCSVVGGSVYRGGRVPSLAGLYLYADHCSGEIFTAKKDANGAWLSAPLLDTSYVISSLGEDENGEVYFANAPGSGGEIYRVTDSGSALLFEDDFTAFDGSKWALSSDGFSIDAGELLVQTATSARAIATYGSCSRCSIEADVEVDDAGGRASVLGWWTNSKNYVELLMNENKNKWTLKQKKAGTVVASQSASSPVDPGTSYHVTLSNDGFGFRVSVNGTQIIAMSTAGVPSGVAGLKAYAPSAHFDNVAVY